MKRMVKSCGSLDHESHMRVPCQRGRNGISWSSRGLGHSWDLFWTYPQANMLYLMHKVLVISFV